MSDQVVVLTGGTGGLGTAVAKRLAADGASLAVTYLMPEEATRFEEAVQLDETRLLLKRVNANDPEELSAFMKKTAERFGRIDALGALVGGWAGGRDIDETDDVRFERMIDLNLRSAFYTVRSAIPHLKEAGGGRMVLVGSRAVDDAHAGQAAFNAAKAGVVAIARTAAQELGHHNITVNVVMPSVIDTPATRATLPYADYVDWPTPDEIAAVVHFLLSGESGVISGATIPVFGRA
ncbi:MAG: SDR family oxidoreductase [Acidimicrobiia bacterium]|nr:SDR family oxidoreductase [Acidimicrobiia bacterium]